jgi:hypothetical protein
MNKTSKIFSWALPFIVLIWILYWFYTHFEQVTETVETDFQGKARYDSLLAAEYLLTRLGTTVLTANTMADLKNKLKLQDLLILVQDNKPLKEEQAAQLLRWVTTGGHLIMVSNTIYDEKDHTSENNDPMLNAIHVFRYENDLDDLTPEPVPPTEISWAATSLQVTFQPNYRLQSTYSNPTQEISDQYGTHLLTYPIGNGIITVLSDFEFIKNDAIGNHDHAQFLWHLVNLERPVTRVWFMQLRSQYDRRPLNTKKDNPASLWQVLWLNQWTVLLSTATLLLTWLWFASRRFGPVLPNPPQTRRRLLEHLEASGNFLWQQGQAQTLLHSTRQALLTRLNLAHPDWLQLPPPELSQRLAQVSNLPAKEIEIALTSAQPFFTQSWQQRTYPESAFTRTISILTQLRKAL